MAEVMKANRLPTALGLVALATLVVFCGCERPQVDAVQVTADSALALRRALGEGKGAQAAGSASEAARPTGWATIRGKFALEGTPPPRTPLSITKNPEVCAPGGKQVLGEELVVDENGGIKDVVVYLTTKIPLDDPAFIHPDYEATKVAEAVFDQKECVFLTHLFAARTTNKIVLKNSDPVGHNTKIDGKGSASLNVTIAANDATGYAPGKQSPEPFDASCAVHPWMSAKMLIRDNPYFAVTKPDGSFEIKNVPAGVKLDFRVWQERLKFIQNVKRTAGGEVKEEKWKRSGYSVTLKPDEVHEMDIRVPAVTR
jgi:hypothetical protein